MILRNPNQPRQTDYSRILVMAIVLYLVVMRPAPDEQQVYDNNSAKPPTFTRTPPPFDVDHRPVRKSNFSQVRMSFVVFIFDFDFDFCFVCHIV